MVKNLQLDNLDNKILENSCYHFLSKNVWEHQQ